MVLDSFKDMGSNREGIKSVHLYEVIPLSDARIDRRVSVRGGDAKEGVGVPGCGDKEYESLTIIIPLTYISALLYAFIRRTTPHESAIPYNVSADETSVITSAE